jgi:Ca-activated chloride channel family protein
MDLLWPGFLALLGLIPLIIAFYIWMLRRRRRYAVSYSSLSLLRQALPRQSQLRRHIPFALFLLAIASLVAALARPVAIISVPADQTTIILALDASGSMRSQDIPPSRLEAAEAAALSFIEHQKSTAQIGLVAFSAFAEIIQPPTANQEALAAAIYSLTTGHRTAIGSAILTSIDSIAEVDKLVAPSVSSDSSAPPVPPVAKGAYAPDIIVLLTDGVYNYGPDPIQAAQQAVDRGIRIYTIGFGTANGSMPSGNQQGQGGFGGQGMGNQQRRGGMRMGIDEASMKQIASMTGGSYYTASSAAELEHVFQSLPTNLITRHETTEISFIFTALGALLAAAAVILSLLWHPLPRDCFRLKSISLRNDV